MPDLQGLLRKITLRDLDPAGPRGKSGPLPWFTRGDLDGFFGLFVDNLLQLMLIVFLCGAVCGFPRDMVLGTVLPGAALSILVGNLFYSWQARRLALATGRSDVTALPYGINTPSLIAFILLIMGPVYRETGSSLLAWKVGLFACLLSGLLETAGAYCGDWLRKNTPRAALLCALAGIAVTFIAMNFIFQIFANPLIAVLPMMLILVAYGSRIKWPWSLPGGLVAVLVGVAVAWALRGAGVNVFTPSPEPFTPALYLPVPVIGDVLSILFSETGWKYLAVILPMALFNVIGSLQNLESAEAAGDRFETKPSLLANGVGSLTAAFFGSPFPTTIYIGHPGWKAMGARSGYSALNGVVIALLCLTGGLSLALKVIPIECTLGILLWIAIIITAQSFQEIPKEHALAVAFGLIPAFAAYVFYVVETSLRVVGVPLSPEVADRFAGENLFLRGIIVLNQGSLLVSMIFAAVMVFLIERRFQLAAGWVFAASLLSFTGLIHAYRMTESGALLGFGTAVSPKFGLMYALTGLIFLALHFQQQANRPSKRKRKGKKTPKDDPGLNKVNNVSYV
jgi:AGZA family xanthine/uracil permease-like MFS transporter